MIDVKVSCLDSVVQAAKQVGVKTVFACFGVERPVPVEEVAVVVHQPGHALVLQYTNISISYRCQRITLKAL